MSDPSLTGMSRGRLQKLARALEVLHHNQVQDRQHERRVAAGKKPHAFRAGRPAQLSFADRVLATILHLRLSIPEQALAVMFANSQTNMRRLLTETRHLLEQHGTTVEPVTPSKPITELIAKALDQPHTKRSK